VIVVASTTVTGRSLLGVSQLLRQVARDGSIVYLVGVARSSTSREWDELCKNLRFGRYADEFPMHALYDLALPDDRELEGSPWSQERQLLISLKEKLTLQVGNELVATLIQERIDTINAAEHADQGGLSNDCFLPRWDGSAAYTVGTARELRLRPGLAMLKQQNRACHVLADSRNRFESFPLARKPPLEGARRAG
jgi:hypothetical protein